MPLFFTVVLRLSRILTAEATNIFLFRRLKKAGTARYGCLFFLFDCFIGVKRREALVGTLVDLGRVSENNSS
jgi:hypothetical protein